MQNAPYPPGGNMPYPSQQPPQANQSAHYPGQQPAQYQAPQQGGFPPPGSYPSQGIAPVGYPIQGGYPVQGGYPAVGSQPAPGGFPSGGYPSGSFPSQSTYPGAAAYPSGSSVPPQQCYPAPQGGFQRPPGQLPLGSASAPPGSVSRTSKFSTKIELHISCKGLVNADVMSTSDPQVVVLMEDAMSKHWMEIGRTEKLENTLNPEFVKTIEVDYLFEEVQKLRFSVGDVDGTQSEFLGSLDCNLGQIVSSKTYTKPLVYKDSPNAFVGTITITADEVSANKDVLTFSFRAKKLDSKDFLGKSDPYLEFSRVDGGSFTKVHRTEVKNNTLDPAWNPFTISVQKLCNGDLEKQIKVDCFDHDDDGSHDLIGSFTTTVTKMLEAQQREVMFECVNPKKQQKKKGYTNSGTIYLSRVVMSKEHSFVDFISSGLQINFTVAIDFTASNGAPNDARSLHYMNPYQPNQYISALTAVGEVCQDYDSDKLFPAYGFGAKIPPENQVHHEFPLNFNVQNPNCQGVQGIVQAYQNALQYVQLYGPTNFSPVINHVARLAAQAGKEPKATNYYILLILTDGEITDMEETKVAIVNASFLPMSIIIVGVGDANFDSMEELDADNKRLKAGGKVCERDIVQFVSFRDYRQTPPAALAKCVLAEVPGQVTAYYKLRNVAPTQK